MTLRAVFKKWAERYFSDEEAVIMLIVLVLGFAVIIWFGRMLAPFFTALIIAFLLQGVVNMLTRRHVPQMIAVAIVFVGFVSVMLALAFLLMPLLWNQLVNLVLETPRMLSSGQQWLDELQAQYPTLITPDEIQNWISMVARELSIYGQRALTLSLASLGNVIGLIVYLVLVPILVFFMLKDREKLVGFILSMMPEKRGLMSRIWNEMDGQIANYVRGKVVEIIIVGTVAFITFAWFGLPYSALLAVLVGFSVLIPFIGAAVATLPVAAVAGFHFGLTEEFAYVLVAYGIIQALDGNVLVPILFSEAVNLHPVSIILAVLFFGGVWGFWGIFFAIPLATLLKALVTAWPRSLKSQIASD
ncbi:MULTISPECIES: AI-2E family transporter [unclassified Methylophaga]|jgi:putative permease|uniref:AI-2E family transporter n=1 Tax=unclassified Methylophaga TaxID=2629249 RepID=UPI000C993102|nr:MULTISPECIES: AI-2E family transporter [unclassified Methylophaga]MAK68113.1 AI-2E family transporter [Methylophaga sp.]MAY17866.1 AI-2E family transporter [Methylophaga sp.]MBN46928.1 AI-2E family transporter [Methylophaga sp.]HAO25797.1 AI-2E family transporter [Methylophaga sp.]HCD03962.1 AI-2E family transporter [Methylophaga sp.]|tara:strand:- start:26331 stop:27407 length:1077 start_codon:yes stop_codon:yes gene_type:complete